MILAPTTRQVGGYLWNLEIYNDAAAANKLTETTTTTSATTASAILTEEEEAFIATKEEIEDILPIPILSPNQTRKGSGELLRDVTLKLRDELG